MSCGRPRLTAILRAVFSAAAWMGVWLACAGSRPPPSLPEEPWRLGLVLEEGDPARRASNRLLEQALRDESVNTPRAVERIRRALQVDPTNPWAYLALAREELEWERPTQALAALDQAEARLLLEGPLAPRVEVHLIGLRGEAYRLAGDYDRAAPLLTEAARRAPKVWGDGRLAAAELL
jgi:tetratricopeptide (TPR) repeat protein